TVLAVAAGAWTIGRITTDQPVLPLAGTAPEETAAAGEPSAPATRTVEYRGLELAFPADWTVAPVRDVTFEDVQDPAAEPIVDDFLIAWAPDQAGCAEVDWAEQWSWRERDCVHAKILGPGAIAFTGLIDSAAHSGRSITEDDERGMFYPATQGGLPCPSANGVDPYGVDGEDYVPADDLRGVEDLGGHEWGAPLVAERVTVRGEDALYREYPVTCVRPQGFPPRRGRLLPPALLVPARAAGPRRGRVRHRRTRRGHGRLIRPPWLLPAAVPGGATADT